MASDATVGDVDDPVSYFLDEMTYHGRTERTQHAYGRVLREFEQFLQAERGATVRTATRRDCMAWIHSIRRDAAPSTVATYASYVNRFYGYMNRIGALPDDPMALVVEEMDESIDVDPDRREISVPRMRDFVADVSHPLDRALIVTLLKTGIRVGELSNLDLRDLHLDADIRDAYDVSPRPAIEERPDTLYVASEPARGLVYNGERRSASNKRKRSTVVPVDGEMKRVLREWLAIRPDTTSTAEPLFASTSEWGRRVTTGMARSIVTEHAENAGWHRPGGGAEENVTPHYFRHFFTTHLRDRTGDRGVVKYLRGDVGDDIIDTYTHNWGDRVREVYERHIYSLIDA